MDSEPGDFKSSDFPRTPAEWEKAQRNLKAPNLHALSKLDSGSEIARPQFLLLRALWDVKKQYLFGVEEWLQEQYVQRAVSFLEGCQDWNSYLGSFNQGIKFEQRPFPSLGDFTLVKYSQLEADTVEEKNSSESVLWLVPKTRSVMAREKARKEGQKATPSKVRADQKQYLPEGMSPWSAARKGDQKVLYPPTEDEQIVNVALLNFLTVLTITHDDVCLRWCLTRKNLHFACHDEKYGVVKYQARTDGYLRGQRHSTAYAIVEVKPFIRANKPNTRWQETAQMAAWISEDPPTEGEGPLIEGTVFQRLLVSQDRHEIYLTFARFDSKYVRYLRDGSKEDNPFLKMHEFGPFRTKNSTHMQKVGETILAFTLQMSNEHRQRFGQGDSGAPGGPASAISNDPENLVSSLSNLNPFETPKRPAAQESRRPYWLRGLNLSQSTEDESKRLQKKNR